MCASVCERVCENVCECMCDSVCKCANVSFMYECKCVRVCV